MNIAVVNTKGGVGKSTISSMILPLFFAEDVEDDGRTVNVYEIDNNNKSVFSGSSAINFKNIKVKDAEDVITKVQMDFDKKSDSINIIDSGGGDDTVAILKYMQEMEVEGSIYIIPTNDDIEQTENIKQTISLIKNIDPLAKIILALNRVITDSLTIDEKELKGQFIGLYGNKEMGIEPVIDQLRDELIGIVGIPNTPIFGILKNLKHTTAIDYYIQNIGVVENFSKRRKEWIKQGDEIYKKNYQEFQIAKKLVNVRKSLKEFEELIKKVDENAEW